MSFSKTNVLKPSSLFLPPKGISLKERSFTVLWESFRRARIIWTMMNLFCDISNDAGRIILPDITEFV